MRNQDGESQYSKIQKMSNQPAVSAQQASNAINRGKQVPFGLLLPALKPHLDKDRVMQLHTLYAKLKKNEIVKDVFVRHMRDIVGDQMLRLAVNQMQSQMGANQFQLQSQAAARQQQLRMPSVSASATQFTNPHSFPQLHQKGTNSSTDPALVPASSASVHGSSFPIKKNNAKISLELEHQPGSHGIHVMSELISHEKEKASFALQIADLQAQVAKLSIEKANSESKLARVTSLLQSAELRAEEAKNESQRLREQCSDQNKAFMQAMKELEPVFQKTN